MFTLLSICTSTKGLFSLNTIIQLKRKEKTYSGNIYFYALKIGLPSEVSKETRGN